KFPQPMTLDFLMRWHRRSGSNDALAAVHKTLRAMAQGGMYDQAGGGFHRYSTDQVWLVPHFEKMLYDNALLARTYLDAWKLTREPFYRKVVEETLDYVLREMTDTSGGFYSTQDADSEGVEGKFFLWTPAELEAVLGEDAANIGAYFGVSAEGNFEGSNILNVRKPVAAFAAEKGLEEAALTAQLQAARAKLYDSREQRIHPGRDEKVLTAWNGLMLRAFAEAALAFDSDAYREAAVNNAEFLLTQMRPEKRLLRTWKQGVARLNGYLEDYACLIDGLIALHAATLDQRYLRSALELTDEMLDLFWDDGVQGFFDTGRDHESLVTRPRDFFDNATPSGTSVAIDVLLRLALLTDNQDYERRATTCLRTLAPFIENAPTAFGRLLGALDFYLSTPQELAIVWQQDDVAGGQTGKKTVQPTRAERSEALASPSPRKVRGPGGEITPLLGAVRATYAPNLLVVGGPAGHPDNGTLLLDDREALDGKPTAYLCERYVCQAPTTNPTELQAQLAAALNA
ncbi:MAG TPA: thioredoxin domain-containing protein, partial [Dehalococcoidia bacterium]|nr:thioredoxin domain-containing protein [Dehalococcoidia bacterium]